MPVLPVTVAEFARFVDHTLLRPDATVHEIHQLCQEAIASQFASVCVNPSFLPVIHAQLNGTPVTSCCVIGFPLGADPSAIKEREAAWCAERGAGEIDMVIHIGYLKSGWLKEVEEDIARVVRAAGTARIKVILECCYLNQDEIVTACLISENAGASFVKTSTGFGSGGARAQDVSLMKKTVPSLGVKASGGIRDKETALAMIAAGADRLGLSAGLSIIRHWEGHHADVPAGY